MNVNKKNRSHTDRQRGAKQWGLLGAFLSFFGVLWYAAPIGIYPDSGSYIAMQTGREPLYPLFLLVFRLIFREKDTIVWLAASGQLDSEKAVKLIQEWPALHTAMLVQSLFAAAACFYLVKVIRNIFHLNGLLTMLVTLASLIPYILTPLASSSHMVLNKAVLTEGITFPMFMLFAALMIQGLFAESTAAGGKCQKWNYYGLSFLCALLLVLTRNQMLVVFAVWCAVICFEMLRSRNLRLVCVLLGGILVFFAGRMGLNHLYNRIVHQGYVGADTGSYNMLTTFLYLADGADAELFPDGELKELFLEMHGQMEAEGMTLSDAPEGILNRAYHYEDCYDLIGFGIQQPCLFDYAQRKGIPEGEALNEVVKAADKMNQVLFPAVKQEYFMNYAATVMSGLTRSVSASGTVMGIYSAGIYLLAVLLMLYLWIRNRESKAALLMAFALLMICANVFATAIMIMCLSRYMIYNTALFYIAGLMMLSELIQMRRSGKRRKDNGI